LRKDAPPPGSSSIEGARQSAATQAQDLAAYRTALRLDPQLIPVEDRRQDPRFTPVGPLAKAKVAWAALSDLDQIDADVIDLSQNGLRLAVHAGATPAPGMTCRIQLSPDGQRVLQVRGQVRWVEHHPLIIVFGVQLDSALSKGIAS
jgi:hypothetical protein